MEQKGFLTLHILFTVIASVVLASDSELAHCLASLEAKTLQGGQRAEDTTWEKQIAAQK
jgi:hypothetical protein